MAVHPRLRTMTDRGIDIVYLWVDGADREFRRLWALRQSSLTCLPQTDSLNVKRFRNNQELLYSLRSVCAFAPWVRKIFIVTNGQVPGWLNASHKKITLITHNMIFPKPQDLPTFNSNAIEMNLHHISGLSRKFLFFNDDLFVGRPLSIHDYLSKDGRQYFYLDTIPLHTNPDQGSVHDRAYAYTQRIAHHYFGQSDTRWLPAHCPQLYDRELLYSLEKILSAEFANTSAHVFRAANDLVLRIIYCAYLSASGQHSVNPVLRTLQWGSKDYSFVCMENNLWKMLRAFLHIRLCRPKFFCINDDLREGHSNSVVLRLLRILLNSYYPHKTAFEFY